MATTSQIRVPVASPSVSPRRYGLLDVVSPQTPADSHWSVGVTWEGSVGCGAVTSTTNDECLSGVSPDPLEVTDGCQARSSASGFTVYSLVRRSSIAPDNAAEAFSWSEARTVETEFWNAVVTDADTVDLGDTWPSLAVALAVVEQAIADRYNGLGFIHMAARDASLLTQYLDRTDSGLFTVLGTPVVVGRGYPADETTSLIVGTGTPVLIRGESESVQGFDRASNEAASLVQRRWAIGWDCFAVMAGAEAPTDSEPNP